MDVSIVKCESYTPEVCRTAMEQVLAPWLGFVKSGMRIGVKVNLVAAKKPEQAATVHPALLCALTELLAERGAFVVLGDSPGGLYNAAHLNHVYDVCGLRQCEDAGAQLNQDFSQAQARFPSGVQAKSFTYTAWLDSCDALIDFCKLKTHGQIGMTCGVKNFFGAVPGTMKPEYHYKYPNISDFGDMLVDLYEYFKPALTICDAVTIMEGNGPTMGTPRHVGALLASDSAHKLDLVGAAVLGYKPEEVPTLAAGIRRNLCPAQWQQLDIRGEVAPLLQSNVKKTPAQQDVKFLIGLTGTPLSKLCDKVAIAALTPKPALKKGPCVGCGKCADICPAKAITMVRRRPRIDRSICIRCFCCQEFCPKGALFVSRPPVAKLLNK